MMLLDFLVFDNFYENPWDVREFALEREFYIEGNYPGLRTEPEGDDQWNFLKGYLEEKMNMAITYWPKEANTSYQITTKRDSTWIHYDATDWAGIIYLTPNAPVEAGTAFFRHRDTGIDRVDRNDPNTDFNSTDILDDIHMNKWERTMTVGNIFNRLVLFRGTLYHRSDLPGFGDSKYDCRMTQTFFFDTEA
jgi:hypothetical protein